MNFLRVCWQLLLVFAVTLFLISGLTGEAGLLQEQHEVTLKVQVFGFTNEAENESIPIEGATVWIMPIVKEPGMSEEAEAAFHKYRVTDENGVSFFNLSSSFNYYNTTWYDIHVAAQKYESTLQTVDVANTREVSIFLKKSGTWGEIPPGGRRKPSLTSSLWAPALFITAIVATSVTIAWILKQKHTRKQG